jgi:outer membrane lipopolysaccharide assembly protein LptE/RlpB
MKLSLWFTLAFLLLTGCYFHPRAQHNLCSKFGHIYLESPTPYADFETILRQSLQLVGVQVTRTPGCAPITLHIINTLLVSDYPTIGGSNQSRVYHYYYSVTFEVRQDQCVLIPTHSISTGNVLIVNAGEALESTHQIDILLEEMQKETAHMIINELNSLR